MEEMIEYAGLVFIQRSDRPDGDTTNIPFTVYGPVDRPLSFDQIQEQAYTVANNLLDTIADYDPRRREVYGEPIGWVVLSETEVMRDTGGGPFSAMF